MVTTIVPPTLASGGTVTYAPAPQGMAYKYDRLNRLKSSKAWQDVDAVGNLWATGDGSSYAGMYENNFSYDANGNITAQMRKDATGTAINDLTYNRRNVDGKTVQNRLYHVNDGVSNTAFTDDIDDQGTFINSELVNSDNNYGYDEIGNLNRNNQKEIAEMVYNVTGKVKEVRRTVGSNKENLKFDYDANGNRIAKHVYTSDDVWMKSDYYVNDAQGNNMAIYTLTGSSGAGLSYQLAERNIFGSSRVGTNKTPVEMIGATPPTNSYIHTLGDRNYHLSNHLGNNLVTVTDRKLPVDDGNGMIAFYMPHVISTSDFYPFGVTIKERTFAAQNTRYQFNGKEYDSETETSDFGARNLDGDLGGWGARDAYWKKYPDYSPYNFALNNPIIFIDSDGDDVSLFLNKTSSAALKRFVSTDIGRAFIAQFARAGDVIGGVTFLTEGDKANDLLILKSTSLGDTRDGLTRNYLRNSKTKDFPGGKQLNNLLINDIPSEKNQYTYLVDIDNNISEDRALYVIGHESFVHVQQDVIALDKIDKDLSNGFYDDKPYDYLKALSSRSNSGDVDHEKLSINKNLQMKGFVKQIDLLEGGNTFFKMYQRDKIISKPSSNGSSNSVGKNSKNIPNLPKQPRNSTPRFH